jgi:hypothetical protein
MTPQTGCSCTGSSQRQALALTAGEPLSCASGAAVLSTEKGMAAALASASGRYALWLQRNGRVVLLDQSSGTILATLAGPFTSCVRPFR